MIIRKYGDFPAMQVPDVGEIVKARRSASDTYLRAVVIVVRRMRDGAIKLRVQWLESNPHVGTPIVADTIGWLVQKPGRPPLVLRTSKAQPGDTPS